MSNNKAITYTPAAQILRAPQSSEIPVTPESRSQSYVGTVNPVPQPGTLPSATWRRAAGTCCRMAATARSRAGRQLRRGHLQQKHRGLRGDAGRAARRGQSLILTWNVPTQETQQPTTALKAAQAWH